MSSSFYDKRWEIFIDDELFIAQVDPTSPLTRDQMGRGFKMMFSVLQDYGAYNMYADIRLFNLTQDTANRTLKKGAKITFRAGYVDSIDTIFTGLIRNVFPERAGPDIIYRIVANSDFNILQTINRTLGVNCSVTEIVKALAQAMGYSILINQDDFSEISNYPRGYTLYGDPKVYLDRLAKVHDFAYIVENGRLVVTRNSSYRRGEATVISRSTGMEGMPEISEIGCDVAVRLSPNLRIGSLVNIQSEYSTFNFSNLYFQEIAETRGQGTYKIWRIMHIGDSWGDDWTSQLSCIRPDANLNFGVVGSNATR